MRGPCAGNEWFTIESNKTGTRWTGKVWYFHDRLKYEYDLEFDLPVTYPNVAPELALPELDGKTEKMYRGGKICLDGHFRPLWARNVPRFGIAHAMALGVRAATRRHALRLALTRPSISHRGCVAPADGAVARRRDPSARGCRAVRPRQRIARTCTAPADMRMPGRITHKDAEKAA